MDKIQRFRNSNQNETITCTAILGYCFLIMLFFTKSSPFYLINDWVDANAFFTVGKSMANGRTLYKDIFEQKGPVLYFIHALAYWASNRTFFGIYLFESLGLGVSLICFYQILRLYVPKWSAIIVASFLPLFLLATPFFAQGDSAEEFCSPFVMGLLLLLFRNIKLEKGVAYSKTAAFVQGLSFCMVLLIKYTLTGPWLGFYAVVSVCLLLKKDRTGFLKFFVFSIMGFLSALLPWLAYFIIHDALKDFIYVYFKFNIFMYASERRSMLGALFATIINIFTGYEKAPLAFFITFVGILGILCTNRLIKNMQEKLLLLCVFFVAALAAFAGGKAYHYYWLILMPFASYGLLVAAVALQDRLSINASVATICIFLSFLLTFKGNQLILDSKFFPHNDTYQLNAEDGTPKEPAQIVFARIINEVPNATLLNFNCLDVGLYTTTGIVPNTRFFMLQNVDYAVYPYNYDEQLQYIKDKLVDFVICATFNDRTLESITNDALEKNYDLIATHDQIRNGKATRFWLFQKK